MATGSESSGPWTPGVEGTETTPPHPHVALPARSGWTVIDPTVDHGAPSCPGGECPSTTATLGVDVGGVVLGVPSSTRGAEVRVGRC